MDEKEITIDCGLMAWIKDKAEKSKDSIIYLTVKDGRIIRVSCYTTSVFGEEKR